MRILIVGGAGYIGSHVARECLRAGHEPTIFDSYVTGHPRAVDGLFQIRGDLRDNRSVAAVLRKFRFDAVLHFAGVGRVRCPNGTRHSRYSGNVVGTMNLLLAMLREGVQRLVVCSSGAVYGDRERLPVVETLSTRPVDSYGQSHVNLESVLSDLSSQDRLRFMILRCFNVAGADPGGDLGESYPGQSRLVPRLIGAALGRSTSFEVFGGEFDPGGGAGVRDFVHVSDVARAHVLALEAVDRDPNRVLNIGSGEGRSVLELTRAVERCVGRRIRITVTDRRDEEIAASVARIEGAREVLGWQPGDSDLESIIRSAHSWHRRHPQGYRHTPIRYLPLDMQPRSDLGLRPAPTRGATAES